MKNIVFPFSKKCCCQYLCLSFKASYLGKMHGCCKFLLWIPIVLAKIYFFHMVLIWLKTFVINSKYSNLLVTFFHFFHQFWERKALGEKD